MCENEVKFCSNCKRDVPAGNYMMHHIHCQRKLALCHKCDEPIPHSDLAAHNANLHALVSCPDCDMQMEKRHLAEHKNTSCSHRTVCCNFCHIETEASELAEHENYCGSRTERCEDCGEFVMLKYQQLHQDSNHGFLKLEDEPGPTPSWSTPRSTSNVLNDLSRQRKISNASQDATRPTAASNRLSPSKRTNDMPQVNSAATVSKPKAVHKTTISQGNMSDEDTVDLDRLLALRLAEKDHSLFTIPTAPPDGDVVNTRDMSGDLVALPCEFCEAMIPANQLVLHETGCRPDLAQFVPAPPKLKNRAEPPEDSIPCEFCGEHFPSLLLFQHETGCRPDMAQYAAATTKPRNRQDVADEELPCEFCGALVPEHLLLQHEASCEASSPVKYSVLVNQLGPSKSSARGTKKMLNLDPNVLRLFPARQQSSSSSSSQEGDERNSYLMEVGAALKKPTANVLPLGHHHSNTNTEFPAQNLYSAINRQVDVPPQWVNGYTRRLSSTGAVPKQKAGKTVSIREISQEIPRTSATSVSSSLRRHGLGNSDTPR